MSKQNAFLGKITNLSPIKESRATMPLKETLRTANVKFEGDIKGILDLSYPRAEVWEKMIGFLKKNNRPAYVEIDPETSIITKFYIPEAARVWNIIHQSEEIVYVKFYTSSARHYLRCNHPDFQAMLNSLKAAMESNSPIMVTSAHNDFEIIDVRPLPPSFGNDPAPLPPGPPIPDPPVTWARAVELFNMMNSCTCTPCSATDPCIPFKYPYDGCWIRAHLMCYQMIAEGETPEKIWISGSLLADSSNVPECHVNWGWHIAPTLMVSQPSGPDVKMVIDPSLCTEPVTLDAWKALQGDSGATLTPSAWDQYWPNGGSTVTQSQANNDMEYYRLKLDELCANYGPSPYACPIVKKSFFIVDRSTISNDEVDAMLSLGNPAVIENAFFVVVDGFTPSELGITAATLVGVPNIIPAISIAPSVAQMTIAVMPTIGLEDPVHLIRRQRITWRYKISFTGTAGFVNNFQQINLAASISTVSASASIYLIKQLNPYEIDGETSWLSTDLRVFQIKTGESRFNKTMAANASDFITDVISNLNNGTSGGDTFASISVNQQTSKLELSQQVGGVNVYNFAIAKVRYRSLVLAAQDVRVFFRLFPASSTSLEFNDATTYRRAVQGGSTKPLLGIIGGETVTIPCFAAARVNSSTTSMTQQTDQANVQTIPANATGTEIVKYFGCWLDINQTQPQFPINPVPTDGPYPAASRKTIQELVRNQHQCLVAEIAFDPVTIPANTTPSLSDKLAQRNLAIVESDNPGSIASHRIPHMFEIKPTRAKMGAGEPNDELMIDWGNTPVGSIATLYLPGIDTNNVLDLALDMYRTHTLVRVDSHTLTCETGGITFIPIPQGEGSNFVGLMSIDLPDTVKKGQMFTVVVRQVTGGGLIRGTVAMTHVETHTLSNAGGRRILGSFQITIPVRVKTEMLGGEERLLSNLRWIEGAIPVNNRWFLAFGKYVQKIAGRVDALGGNSKKVVGSPSGEWRKAYLKCRVIALLAILLFAALLIAIGTQSSTVMGISVTMLAVLLIFVIRYWRKVCRPCICKLLMALIAGAGIGTIILALLLLLGVTTPLLLTTLFASAGILIVALIAALRKRCFK